MNQDSDGHDLSAIAGLSLFSIFLAKIGIGGKQWNSYMFPFINNRGVPIDNVDMSYKVMCWYNTLYLMAHKTEKKGIFTKIALWYFNKKYIEWKLRYEFFSDSHNSHLRYSTMVDYKFELYKPETEKGD